LDLTQNTIFRRKHEKDKQSIVDVLAVLEEGTKVNVEMQKVSRYFSVKRFLYYWSITYGRGFEKGSHYEDLNDAICILIVEGKLPELENLPYHTIWRVKCEEDTSRVLTSVLELHIIELGKLKENCGNDPELDDWLWFIADPKDEKVKKSMEQKPEIKEAMEKLRVMSEDEEMQLIAFYEDLADHDRATRKFREERAEEKIKEAERMTKDAEKKQKDAEKKQKDVEKKQKDVEKKQKDAEKKQKDVEKKQKDIEKKQKDAEKKQKDIEKKQKDIDEKQKEIERMQKEIEKTKAENEEREKAIQKGEKAIQETIIKEKEIMIKNMIENSIPEESIMKIANITKEELEKLKR